MAANITLDEDGQGATLHLAGPCATEHAAGLAAAWLELLGRVDAAKDTGTKDGFGVRVDFAAATSVGLAFLEITAAAALALSRRGLTLGRAGELPENVAQAARLSGFASIPMLADVFAGAWRPETSR